jgi:hypothetical protein
MIVVPKGEEARFGGATGYLILSRAIIIGSLPGAGNRLTLESIAGKLLFQMG